MRRSRRATAVFLRRFIGRWILTALRGGRDSTMLHAVLGAEDTTLRIVCAGRLLLCTAAGILLGCAGDRFSSEAPPGVSLTGVWRLNRTASDDPQRVLERMRAEAVRSMSRRAIPAALPRSRGAGTSSAPEDGPPPGEEAASHGAGRADPLLRSPMAHVLLARLARGESLSVRQTPGEFTLDYGNSRRSFTSGTHSVVSAEGGVADQICGWKGREYVIEVRAQSGPDVTERYGLTKDGKHLVERLHIAPAELPGVDLTRVYDPSSESAPRQAPTSD